MPAANTHMIVTDNFKVCLFMVFLLLSGEYHFPSATMYYVSYNIYSTSINPQIQVLFFKHYNTDDGNEGTDGLPPLKVCLFNSKETKKFNSISHDNLGNYDQQGGSGRS